MKGKISSSLIAGMGNFSQWFDNTLFNFMLPLIIYNFIPGDSQLSDSFVLLISYSATVFTRPFGAVIFSHFSDNFGRKKVLVLTSFIMSFSMLFLGVCPPIGIIGVAAPAFLLLFTFMHGFSSGSEWPNSICYLYETSSHESRARQGLIVAVLSILGLFLGNVLVSLSVRVGSSVFIGEYSWRILFLLSAFMAFFVGIKRSKLPESPIWRKPHDKFKFSNALKHMYKPLSLSFMIAATEGVCFNLFFNNFYPFSGPIVNRAYEFIGSGIALAASFFLFKLTVKLGAIRSLKIGLISLFLIGCGQLFISDELASGPYRFLYVLPTFLYLVPVNMTLPSLFEERNRAFGLAMSRNSAMFIFGGVGLIAMRWLMKDKPAILAYYIIALTLLSYSATYILGRKKTAAY